MGGTGEAPASHDMRSDDGNAGKGLPTLHGMRQFYVYMLASLSRRLYVGVTNDLGRRMTEHRRGTAGSHTGRYRITRLVYFEQAVDARAAIAREKELKRWPRERKARLVEGSNHGWIDLARDW